MLAICEANSGIEWEGRVSDQDFELRKQHYIWVLRNCFCLWICLQVVLSKERYLNVLLKKTAKEKLPLRGGQDVLLEFSAVSIAANCSDGRTMLEMMEENMLSIDQ